MTQVIQALTGAFASMLRWPVLKRVLTVGIPVTLLWGLIGWGLWDSLVALGAHILEYVPFSMVRSNGAWMLSSFLWLQVVLVTFALIYAFFGTPILRHGDRDRFGAYALYILGGSALFWAAVWLVEGDTIYRQFLKLLTWLPFETVEKGIAFLIAFYILYNGIVVTMLFVTSVCSEPLIHAVVREEPEMGTVHTRHILSSIGYTLRDTGIFLLLSLLAFPLLFVPLLNILVQAALWMWLAKDTLSHDAAALASDQTDPALFRTHRTALWVISLVSSLLIFVPFLNLFAPYLGEIAMFRYFSALTGRK